MKVLFVCWANVGRSQMAKALYNKFTASDEADSAGAGVHKEQPDGTTVGKRDAILGENYVSRARKALLEKHQIDITHSARKQITPEMLADYDLVVNIAEKFQTPDWLKGDNVIWWDIKDPGLKIGMDPVHQSMTEIEKRVKKLIEIERSGGDYHQLDDNINGEL